MARALRAVDVAVAPQERELGRTRSGKAGWIPCEAPGARKLGTAQVEALCRLGIRVERLMGCPQDVEWAEDRAGRLVLLQARPVTARAELPRGGKTIWTRRFVGERWPRGVTPLGWSLLEPELTHLVSYPRTSARLLGGDPPFRVVQGHPYVNVTVFRHLAFKLPGAPPPRFMLELLPPDDVRRWTHRMGAPPDFAVLGAILRETAEDRRWRRFSWNPWTNPRDWAAFVKRLDQELPALEAAPPEEALPRARPLLRAYVGIHVVSLLFAHLGWEVLSPRLGAEADVLLQPPHGSVTARVNAELRAVAMLSGPAREERLADFLARHGHRADESWEIWSPRWQEHPARVLALAEAMRPHTAPALDTAEARLEELPPPLRAATRLARTYLGFREEQRYHLERLLWRLKQQLRALGARWLEDPEDTRFLRVEEIEAGLEGALDPTVIRATAARRAREHAAEDPPEFLEGDAALPVVEEASARIQGLGVSPGLARGRARVLRRPEEGRLLRDGEILVVPSSDPGWTPLLYRAGGLVLELGSQLGHGAIVARELRLPAVANVPHATHRFRDGEELSLDGRSGVVWRHDGP
jgi:pyruvate,water dikinase